MVIAALDQDLIDTNNCNNDKHQPRKRDSIPLFLENEFGKLIHFSCKKCMWLTVRGWWNEHINHSNMPKSWSKTSASLRDKFCSYMETKFAKLQLCADHWKADVVWKLNYHSRAKKILTTATLTTTVMKVTLWRSISLRRTGSIRQKKRPESNPR